MIVVVVVVVTVTVVSLLSVAGKFQCVCVCVFCAHATEDWTIQNRLCCRNTEQPCAYVQDVVLINKADTTYGTGIILIF